MSIKASNTILHQHMVSTKVKMKKKVWTNTTAVAQNTILPHFLFEEQVEWEHSNDENERKLDSIGTIALILSPATKAWRVETIEAVQFRIHRNWNHGICNIPHQCLTSEELQGRMVQRSALHSSSCFFIPKAKTFEVHHQTTLIKLHGDLVWL